MFGVYPALDVLLWTSGALVALVAIGTSFVTIFKGLNKVADKAAEGAVERGKVEIEKIASAAAAKAIEESESILDAEQIAAIVDVRITRALEPLHGRLHSIASSVNDVQAIIQELKVNGGESIKDKVNAIARATVPDDQEEQ